MSAKTQLKAKKVAQPKAPKPEAPKPTVPTVPEPKTAPAAKVAAESKPAKAAVAKPAPAEVERADPSALGAEALPEDEGVPALHGWRAQVFGNDAIALRKGDLAIALEGGEAVVVELED